LAIKIKQKQFGAQREPCWRFQYDRHHVFEARKNLNLANLD
jgi:hypothetical protein